MIVLDVRVAFDSGLELLRVNRLDEPDESGAARFQLLVPPVVDRGLHYDDVLRLRSSNGFYEFLEVARRSGWTTARPICPPNAEARPEYALLQASLVHVGCVVHGEAYDEDGCYLIISSPPGAPEAVWRAAYETFLQDSANTTAQGVLETRRVEKAKKDEARRTDRRRWSEAARRTERRRVVREAGRVGASLLLAGTLIGLFIRALALSAPIDRPRISAIAMLLTTLPLWVGWSTTSFGWALRLGSASTAAGAVFLGTSLAAHPGWRLAATLLGLAYATTLGLVGGVFGVLLPFSSDRREKKWTAVILVLPCLTSATAALSFTIASAHSIPANGPRPRSLFAVCAALFVFLLYRQLRTNPREWFRAVVAAIGPIAFIWLVGSLLASATS